MVTVLPKPSYGSAIALSWDDTVALAVNRDVGSVSFFSISAPGGVPPSASKTAELSVGAEPWQTVVNPDNTEAFVILRRDQQLVRLRNITLSPVVEGRVAVGSEPTGIAMTPTGGEVWITNWVDGTVSIVDTASLQIVSTIDLNAALAATGLLGPVTSRPALAHPRSIAITNNGDTQDDDEFAYVTEYYAQQTAAEAANGSNSDSRKVGIVYRVAVSNHAISTIQLRPLADLGFKDDRNQTVGCYPNQLQAIAINGNFAFVTSVCASPLGPIGVKVTTTACTPATIATDCVGLIDPVCVSPVASASTVCVDTASVKTTTAPLVSVINLYSGAEVPAARVSLNASFQAKYVSLATPDNNSRRYPLFAGDMAFLPGTAVGYVIANGADAVFRIRFDAATANLLESGSSLNPFIDLTAATGGFVGRGPVGIAITQTGKGFLLVANDITRNITVVDLNTQAISGGTADPKVVSSTALPAAASNEERILQGKRFFNTGLARWSLKGQGWGSCQSCHGDGLSDNVTWYFARGPRQSTSLDGSFSKTNSADQRIFNWTAIFDEVADFELNTRGISGGVGAIVSATSSPPGTGDRIDIAGNGNAGLNGSAAAAADTANPLGLTSASLLADWANITAYMKTIRSPRRPTNLDSAKVSAGRTHFETNGGCAGCHAGAKWTISTRFYNPTGANMTALLSKAWPALNGFPASLQPAISTAGKVMRYGSTNLAAFDQLLCILRPVGTFNVAESGVGIAEVRADMTTVAQGAGDTSGDGRGFNPPSLLGVSVGAPYLHGGQARTLEATFGATFATHHQSLAPNFLTDTDPGVRAQKTGELVSFLLSIDESTTAVGIPSLGGQGGDFCQFP